MGIQLNGITGDAGQPSGTSVCYKITTHNQSASKKTRIHAVSHGWK